MRTPTVLVVDDEPANRLFVVRVLEAADWDVTEAVDGREALARAREMPPDLVIMDIDMPLLDGWGATAALRAAGPPLSGVPVLAYTTMRVDDATIAARGLDGRLPKPCAAEALVTAVARWRPDGEMNGVHRLQSVFGADELAPLIARFRAQLGAALTSLGAGEAVEAHRLAGVAGTLGFAAVSESWLRLSEGDHDARDQARRDARRAIAGIDRDSR